MTIPYTLQQIVAVIVSATGVALLAHMDSTTNRKNITLRSVLLATGAAIGFAVFKVRIFELNKTTDIRYDGKI